MEYDSDPELLQFASLFGESGLTMTNCSTLPLT